MSIQLVSVHRGFVFATFGSTLYHCVRVCESEVSPSPQLPAQDLDQVCIREWINGEITILRNI